MTVTVADLRRYARPLTVEAIARALADVPGLRGAAETRPGSIVLLGFDALGWESLAPFMDEGVLPNVAAVLERGALGPLASVAYPSSAAAWSACMTGLEPGKTGVLAYEVPRRGSYETCVFTPAMRTGEPVWRVVERHGRRVVIAGIPSFGVEPVNGVMVSGSFTADGLKTHPADLSPALHALGLDADPLEEVLNAEGISEDERFEFALRLFANRGRLALALYRLAAADLFTFIFVDTDRLLSRYFADPARRRAVAQVVDQIVGEFLTSLQPAVTLLIVSDHGLRPYQRNFNPFRWLYDGGWLNAGAAKQARALETRELRRKAGSQLQYLAWWLARRLPGRDAPLLRWLPIPQFARGACGPGVQPVVWSATRAYPFPSWRFSVSMIRLNLRGRDPEGVVAPGAEAEALIDEMRATLLKLRDPATGAPVVEWVRTREDLFEGPRVAEFPELFYKLTPPYCASNVRDYCGPLFYDEAEPRSCHSHEGVLLAVGPSVQSSARVAARVADIAPTVLHLAGLPVDAYLDGKPCLELFTPEFRAREVHRIETDYAGTIERQAAEGRYSDDRYIRAELARMGYV